KEQAAHLRIRRRVLEHAGPGHRSPLYPAASEQFAPAPGAFLVGRVDRGGIEGQSPRAQTRHGEKAPRPGLVELEQHILPALSGHVFRLSRMIADVAVDTLPLA